MQKYYFEAVNRNNEKVTGYLFAETEAQARQKLNKNEMAVIMLQLYQEDPLAEGILRFEFEAVNSQGNKFQGEVEASDLYEAYKKLRKEHQFDVMYLVDKSEEEEIKSEKKAKGVPREILERFNEEELLSPSSKTEKKEKKESSPKKQEKSKKLDVILQENEEKMRFLQDQIGDIIEKVQGLVKKHEDFLKTDKKRHIWGELDRLARLKQSNSVDHLKNIILDLFNLLGTDDIFIEAQGELLKDMEEVRGEFKTLSMSFRHTINKKLASITIDVESLKTGIDFLKNHRKNLLGVLRFFQFIFWGIFCGAFGLLVFGFIRKALGGNFFYLDSQLFWMILIFSGLGAGYSFFQERILFRWSWQKNLLLAGFFLLGLGVLFFQFPVIFFWTRF